MSISLSDYMSTLIPVLMVDDEPVMIIPNGVSLEELAAKRKEYGIDPLNAVQQLGVMSRRDATNFLNAKFSK